MIYKQIDFKFINNTPHKWCSPIHEQISLIRIIRLFVWGLAFDFQFLDLFLIFGNTWHPSRNGSQLVRLAEHLHKQQTVSQWKTFVLTYSMHIYFMKNILLWAHLPHIYIRNNELKHAKDTTCDRTLCYHKTKCDACVFFLSTVPRCERKSWISEQ